MKKTYIPSKWNNKAKFNGFFFGLNIALVSICEHNELHLFDPALIMVGQEDALMVIRATDIFRVYVDVVDVAFPILLVDMFGLEKDKKERTVSSD